MVAVANLRFERGPIKSRLDAFPCFSSTNGRFKGTQIRLNQGLDLDLRSVNLVITVACLSSREDMVL